MDEVIANKQFARKNPPFAANINSELHNVGKTIKRTHAYTTIMV